MATPRAPSNVYVQQGNGQVLVSFDITAGATSYSILRSIDGITYASIATTAVNSYIDITVSLNTLYYYSVIAIGTGSSAASIPQSIVPTGSGVLSLGQLRLMAQQRADRVNSNFVTLPEWNTYLNQSRLELYDLLVTVYEDYYLAPHISMVTTGTDSIPLPDGVNYSKAPAFYKLWGLDMNINGDNNAYVTLRKFNAIDRNKYVYPNVASTVLGIGNVRYRVAGDNILLIPTPSNGQTLRLWYIPRLSVLLADTDACDGVSGWTEYIIVDAAIKALQKEESDVSVLFAQKQALIDRIQSSAMNRDVGQADTISNTRRNGFDSDPSDDWGNY